jgi:predicted DCC family thiol-disulfide oxidoreductase YuxK
MTRVGMPRRDWHSLPAGDLPDRLIVFDGVCVLCSHWVDFVIARDTAARFRFVAIQTSLGRSLAARFGIDPDAPESNAAIVDGRAYFKLESVLVVLAQLPRWGWTRIAYLLPRTLRDFLYDRIARNRYRVFGRRDTCHVPAPNVIGRFLDVSEAREPR